MTPPKDAKDSINLFFETHIIEKSIYTLS